MRGSTQASRRTVEGQRSPEMDRSAVGQARDRVGWLLATLGLKIATPWYRNMISGSIRLGLNTAVRESKHE